MTTTNRPYTDDDLRAEAARQLADLAEGDDYTDEDDDLDAVGERMTNETIQSRKGWSTSAWWHSLPDEQFEQAQRAIHGLITGAADCSAWAVGLGADGLQPDEHTLTWSAGTTPIVRLHLAFHPRISPEARTELATQLAEACGRILADAAGPRPTDES